jgi:hypothetical protein
MLDVVRSHLEKEGRKNYGAGRMGRERKEIKSVPQASVVKETKHKTGGSVSPILPSSHFLPSLVAGTAIAYNLEGPLVVILRGRVGWGWRTGTIPSVDGAQATQRKAFW